MKAFPRERKYVFFVATSYLQQLDATDKNPANINLMIASRTLDKAESDYEGFQTIEG